jgi:uncharacterized protein (DUF302 family)
MQNMMFTIYRSDLDFEQTVDTLKASAEEHGWQIPMVHDLQAEYRQAGFEEMTRATVLYFCNPGGGYQILKEDQNKPLSVLMPMGVSVYETNSGEVHIAGMDLSRMSMVFSGVVKEVLSEGAESYAKSLAGVGSKKEAENVQVDGQRCCLGCLSFTAITAVLLGIIGTVAFKLFRQFMPKMMSKMMPEMMASMEEAGVKPPCAQIILDHFEKEA